MNIDEDDFLIFGIIVIFLLIGTYIGYTSHQTELFYGDCVEVKDDLYGTDYGVVVGKDTIQLDYPYRFIVSKENHKRVPAKYCKEVYKELRLENQRGAE